MLLYLLIVGSLCLSYLPSEFFEFGAQSKLLLFLLQLVYLVLLELAPIHVKDLSFRTCFLVGEGI